MAQTVKQFVADSYALVGAQSPTVPLHGSDMLKGIQFLNELVQSYSANGLMTTIAQEVTVAVTTGQGFITFGEADYTPTPDVTTGRLSNLQNAWLTLDNVTYPLIDQSRNVFFSSYKYDPLQGLPRYCIITNQTNLTTMQIYPAPSQAFTLHVYGKFQLPVLGENDDMSGFPSYYTRFLKFALGKDISMFRGRAEAWTPKLEQMLMDAKKDMEAVSPVNLVVETSRASLLNGAWRVRAGI